MTRNLSALLGFMSCLLAAACGRPATDVTQPAVVQTESSGPGDMPHSPTPSAAAYLATAGCSPLVGRPRVGTVLIDVVSKGRTGFDCAGVPLATIIAVVRDYRLAVASAIAGAHTQDGWWMLSYSGWTNNCSSWGYQGSVYYPDGSEQSGLDVPELDTIGVTEDCTWTDFFTATWTTVADGGPDPGPPESAGDNPSSPDTTPVDSFPIDTCHVGNEPVGALNHFPILDSMNAALADAIADSTEIAFLISYDSAAHQFHFQRVETIADSTDNCQFAIGTWHSPYPPVALGHTHLYSDGTEIHCRLADTTVTVTDEAGGGGSQIDWNNVPKDGIPWYTIDPDHIFLLPTNLDWDTRGENNHMWDRKPDGTCPLA